MTANHMTALSLAAGVQSAARLLLAAYGRIDPGTQTSIFDQLAMAALSRAGGIEIGEDGEPVIHQEAF